MDENIFMVDGDTSLKQQQDTLNTAQNLLFAEVKTYKKGVQIPSTGSVTQPGPKHPNFVSVEEVGLGVPVRPIVLVIPADLESENITQTGQGRSLFFFSEVFVDGVGKKVAGYH